MKQYDISRETGRVGQRGSVVIPANLRRRFNLQEGSLVVIEPTSDGVLVRPAVALPVETYSPRRKAEFLLNNAVDARDYRKARQAVKEMGLDPDAITHRKPRKA